MAATDTSAIAPSYRTLVKGCGLIDRSARGKLALTGTGAVAFLNGQITNELIGLRPGEGRYAAFLTHKGKMLGDLRVLAIGEDTAGEPTELLLDTERVALQALFDMIRRFKVGYDVGLHKRTLELGLLSLVGPESHAVLTRALDSISNCELEPEIEHAHVAARIAERDVRIVTTDAGGIDVVAEADDLEAVRAALLEAGAEAVTEAVAEIVRVERGRPRYGVDIDESTIPQEAALNERAVSFTKGCYVGQETVARLYYKGKPNRHLRGLKLTEPLPGGAELRLGERPVGTLSSSVDSPSLGPIGLALVRREAEPGATLSVVGHNARATVVELPFPSDQGVTR